MRDNRHKLKHEKFRLSTRKTIFHTRTLEQNSQIAQRDCAVSILGCLQDPAGQSPEKSGLTSG